MRKTLIMICGTALLAAIMLSAQEGDKLKDLQKKRTAIEQDIFNKRVELIEKDPKVAEIHRQIMKLHAELANELAKNVEMKKMLDERAAIDAEIAKIPPAPKEPGK